MEKTPSYPSLEPTGTLEAVLFDIGGVLLRLDYREAFRELDLGSDAETHAAMTRLGEDPDYDAFERGTIGEVEYWRRLSKKLPYPPSLERFREVWNGVVGDPFDGIVPLLERLRRRTRVYALTNSNETHFASVLERFPWFREFNGVFSSHQMGLRKPEAAIFRATLEHMNVRPEHVLYFDDRRENVDAAKAAGVDARRVEHSPRDILRALEERLRDFAASQRFDEIRMI